MPAILISVQNGSIVQVSSMIRDLSARVIDLDLAHGGKPATADVPHRLYGHPVEAELEPTPPISEEEVQRFLAEMEGNFDGHRTSIRILLNFISESPVAASAFREWLASDEEEHDDYCEVCGKPAPEPPPANVPWEEPPVLCDEHRERDVPDPPEASLYADGILGPFQADDDDPYFANLGEST